MPENHCKLVRENFTVGNGFILKFHSTESDYLLAKEKESHLFEQLTGKEGYLAAKKLMLLYPQHVIIKSIGRENARKTL